MIYWKDKERVSRLIQRSTKPILWRGCNFGAADICDVFSYVVGSVSYSVIRINIGTDSRIFQMSLESPIVPD